VSRLAELVVTAHQNSCSKGFWPLLDGTDRIDWDHEDADVPTKFALIHSEISEALEAYRNPKWDVKTTYADISGNGTCWIPYEQAQKNSSKILKPEGFPSELADVVIRCADLAGAKGVSLDTDTVFPQPFGSPGQELAFHHMITTTAYAEIVNPFNLPDRSGWEKVMAELVGRIFTYADHLGVDLWREIDIKTGYNATRTARHGGRRA
jgi:hypothetical protein